MCMCLYSVFLRTEVKTLRVRTFLKSGDILAGFYLFSLSVKNWFHKLIFHKIT